MHTKLMIAALISAGMLVGCGRESDETPTPPAQPKPVPQAAGEPAPVETRTPASSAETAVETAISDANRITPAVTNNLRGAAFEPGAGAAAAGDAGVRTEKLIENASAPQSAAIETQARDLLTKAKDYIQQNKLLEAEGVVAQLENLKAKLPASLQSQVGDVRTLLDQAKAKYGGALQDLSNLNK